MALKLIPDDEIEFDQVECADCGDQLDVPAAWSLPFEVERVICSSCWAVRAKEHHEKKLREQHSKPWGLAPPTPIPDPLPLPPKPPKKKGRDQLKLF